jgi:hypothetical protein
MIEEVSFAADSPLEGRGFEPPVPLATSVRMTLPTLVDAAGTAEDRKRCLFRTARGHNGSVLSDKAMSQPDVWRMIRRRAEAQFLIRFLLGLA